MSVTENNNFSQIINEHHFTIAKSLRGGLFQIFDPNSTPSFLTYLYDKCKIANEDSMTDKIFKAFILTGSVMGATEYINRIGYRTVKNRIFIPTDISDCIFFEKSSDAEITIIAKSIYHHTCPNKGFIEWEINKLIDTGDIGSHEQESLEYQNYKKSIEETKT